ncbi:cupin domain-containing protein [Roseibium algae]|uniref:Cupin domain-containing protein n=1 Tax=Roseibium algae TaxID=3123038 RepID=A0ABU8TRE7_9HYPH
MALSDQVLQKQANEEIVEEADLQTVDVSSPNEAVNGLFTLAHMDRNLLEPAPIPAEWILDGKPEARCKNLSTGTRGWATTDHWSCTKGKFRWHYGWDEAVMFLEGEVVITDDSGQIYLGRPGTTLFFPAGTSATWDVPRYIRKIAFNQRPVPGYLNFAARVVRKLRTLIGLQAEPKGGLG